MKVTFSLLLLASLMPAIAHAADNSFAHAFTKRSLVQWCDTERTEGDVKICFGSQPIVTHSVRTVPGSDVLISDSTRFCYPIEISEDGRMRRVDVLGENMPSLVFRFRGGILIEVSLFATSPNGESEALWKKESKPAEPGATDNPGNAQ